MTLYLCSSFQAGHASLSRLMLLFSTCANGQPRMKEIFLLFHNQYPCWLEKLLPADRFSNTNDCFFVNLPFDYAPIFFSIGLISCGTDGRIINWESKNSTIVSHDTAIPANCEGALFCMKTWDLFSFGGRLWHHVSKITQELPVRNERPV